MFKDRIDAGNQLAEALRKIDIDKPATVFALPRGGIVLGAVISKRLNLPLNFIITRKIGHPLYPEYAIAAITESGAFIPNYDELQNVNPEILEEVIKKERQEAARRRQVYQQGASQIAPTGQTVILIDDGIATGLTMLAAIHEIRQSKPKKIIVATPVIPDDVATLIRSRVDKLVALLTPKEFAGAVGSYYSSFDQVSDDEVIAYLCEANRTHDKPQN